MERLESAYGRLLETLALVACALVLALTVEMLFRMRRLYLGPRTPRDDAVSTG